MNQRITTPPDMLVKRMCYSTFSQNAESAPKACQYGINMEPEARDRYVSICNSKGYQVEVEERGLIINKTHSWLGASVDGVVKVSAPNEDTGLLEIKCPDVNTHIDDQSSIPKTLIELCHTRKYFYLTFDGISLGINKKHNHYFQVQAQLGVLQLQWCDFMVYYKVEDLDICCVSITRVEFDRELYENQMLPKLYDFYLKGIVAEKITRRIEKGQKLCPNSKQYIYST